MQTGEFEVLRGVHDDIDQIDIDVMIRYQNQIGIIEAKTAEKGEVTGLKGFAQLNTAMRYLKGTYIRPFLVIDGTADKHLASMCLSFKIPIIQLSHFEREGTTTTLSDTDSRKLLNDIKEKMRVD